MLQDVLDTKKKRLRKDGCGMKKLIVILALVAVVGTPAMAAVTVSCAQVGTTNQVTVSYSGASITDSNQAVRAFALDISVNSGLTITGVSCTDANYSTYPGSIQITGGSVTNSGSCDCNSSDYPGVTQPGLGTSAVTIEMGSLYSGATKPAVSGVIATLTLSACSDGAVVSIAGNAARGGVVFENPDSANGVTLTGATLACASPECLKNTIGAEYTKWEYYDKPDCWCYKKNCSGDADGAKTFLKPVMISDLNIWKGAYNQSKTVVKALVVNGFPGICADFDRADTFLKPVMISDLNIWKDYYNDSDGTVPYCDSNADGVLESGDKFNFWTN